MVRSLVGRSLAADGFEVESFATARDAIRYFHAIDPDALVTDIDLGERPNGIELSQRVRDRIRVVETPVARAADRIGDLVELWADVLAVDTTAEPAAWAALDAHPALLDRAVDVVAEGLTNAVRHGSAREVTLSVTSHDGAVVMRIGSPGTLSATARPSLGIRTVAESADAWELAQVDDRVDLTVSLRPR